MYGWRPTVWVKEEMEEGGGFIERERVCMRVAQAHHKSLVTLKHIHVCAGIERTGVHTMSNA